MQVSGYKETRFIEKRMMKTECRVLRKSFGRILLFSPRRSQRVDKIAFLSSVADLLVDKVCAVLRTADAGAPVAHNCIVDGEGPLCYQDLCGWNKLGNRGRVGRHEDVKRSSMRQRPPRRPVVEMNLLSTIEPQSVDVRAGRSSGTSPCLKVVA